VSPAATACFILTARKICALTVCFVGFTPHHLTNLIIICGFNNYVINVRKLEKMLSAHNNTNNILCLPLTNARKRAGLSIEQHVWQNERQLWQQSCFASMLLVRLFFVFG